MSPHAQSDFRVRFGWGLTEAFTLTAEPIRQLVVVADVLSFTTTLSVAADLGIEVWPYRWRDASAQRFADERGATLAVGRGNAVREQVSLSPASLRRATDVRRLVLPSPNGSTIAEALDRPHLTVAAACLRNAEEVANLVATEMELNASLPLTVVAAGEHWDDRSLRPAVEDLWGAGAVLAAVLDSIRDSPSPEARTAAAVYQHIAGAVPSLLFDCASGRELVAAGYRQDVEIAAEIASSRAVPVLLEGRFVNTA